MSIIQALIGSIVSGGGSPPSSPNAYATYGASPTEGYDTNITVYAENWNGTTIYWTVVGRGSPAADTSTDMSGTLSGSWNPGVGTDASLVTTLTFTADSTTEGEEYWGVNLGTSPGASDIWASPDWTISDASVQAPADFTIEWWQKVETSSNNARPWAVGLYPTQQLAISYESGTTDFFWVNNSYQVPQTVQNHQGQGWRHIAYVRNAGVISGYLNGTRYTANIPNTQQITGTDIPLYVGTGETGAGNYKGFITNLHIMKGHAKYIDNFTPPTEPTVPTASSVFLIPARDNVTPYADITDTPHGASGVGSPTWSSDTPFTTPAAAGPYTQYSNSYSPDGGEYAGSVDFQGGNYNADLLNVKRGWIVTDGTNTGYVINDAYEVISGVIRMELTIPTTGPATYTFTQYQVGGSIYFNGSSYLNYGASADWAPDA